MSQMEMKNEELSNALENKSARLNDALETISELNARLIYFEKKLQIKSSNVAELPTVLKKDTEPERINNV